MWAHRKGQTCGESMPRIVKDNTIPKSVKEDKRSPNWLYVLDEIRMPSYTSNRMSILIYRFHNLYSFELEKAISSLESLQFILLTRKS